MGKLKKKDEYEKIVCLLNSLTGKRSLWQVFNDCISVYAVMIQNSFMPAGKRFDNIERIYKNTVEDYTDTEKDVMLKTFAEIVVILNDKPFQDLLGDLYMRLDMGNEAIGQFFTPYNISLATAKAMLKKSETQEKIAKKGHVTVLEPAAGGGANLIAACEVFKDFGIDYQKNVVFVAQELNRLTALMCYVALSLIGANAVIKIGDTLKAPYTNFFDEIKNDSEIWITPMFAANDFFGVV